MSPSYLRHCFAHTEVGTGENEIWVMILEKAWAKLIGSYKKQEAGFPHFALAHLTGAPTSRVQHDEIDKDLGARKALEDDFKRAK
jgi:hypothetical protein